MRDVCYHQSKWSPNGELWEDHEVELRRRAKHLPPQLGVDRPLIGDSEANLITDRFKQTVPRCRWLSWDVAARVGHDGLPCDGAPVQFGPTCFGVSGPPRVADFGLLASVVTLPAACPDRPARDQARALVAGIAWLDKGGQWSSCLYNLPQLIIRISQQCQRERESQ